MTELNTNIQLNSRGLKATTVWYDSIVAPPMAAIFGHEL